jgi:hypothetical protein
MSELDPAPDAPTNDPPPVDPAPAPDPTPSPAPSPDPAPSDPPPADPEPVKGDWPDDWRERLAGDDAAFLRQLKRYSSPTTFAKGFKEREDLIRSGKVQRDMPDPADEKAVAEWRKEQGIPDDPTGYVLPETITKRLVDADKPMLANFTEFAHKNNLPPSFVEKGAEWYTTLSEQVAEKQVADDTAASEACEDALRKDWAHGEFKANLTLGKRFMESIPGIGASWTEARLPDGRRLGDIAEFVAWSADMGRERFGDSVFASPDAESRHSNRLQEIEALMKSNYQEYLHKGLQDEHMKLLERESKRRK